MIARVSFSLVVSAATIIGLSHAALAQEGAGDVAAVTNVQEAIAVLASQPELLDDAAHRVNEALQSRDTRGVDLDLVRQAQAALQADQPTKAQTLLERSIGACPGAPVINPDSAPRRPPPLASPCPSVAHLLALSRSPIGGTAEPVLLAVAGVLILAGLTLVRRVR